MDDHDEKNGGDEPRSFDLSRPQEGEPVPDPRTGSAGSAGGAEGGQPRDQAQPRPPATEQTAARPPDHPAGDEHSADTGAEAPTKKSQRGPGKAMPLPLLAELEGEPPPRPRELPRIEYEAAEPAAEAGTGRRISEQWRIDLKWIFGIPATVLLILTLGVFAMFRVTDAPVATGVIGATRAQLAENGRFSGELRQVDPELLVLIEGESLAERLYRDPDLLEQAVDALPVVTADDPMAGRTDSVRTTLGFFNALTGAIGEKEHMEARSALVALVLLTLLFGVPYFIFSRRLGRVVSVAVSLALASWIPYLALRYLRGNLSDWIAAGAGTTQDHQDALILGMTDTFLGGLAAAALPVYRFFSLVALILLGFGLLGLLIVWWRFDEGIIPRKRKLRD